MQEELVVQILEELNDESQMIYREILKFFKIGYSRAIFGAIS